MPVLLHIIWDANWVATERAMPASSRLEMYVQIKMEVENAGLLV